MSTPDDGAFANVNPIACGEPSRILDDFAIAFIVRHRAFVPRHTRSMMNAIFFSVALPALHRHRALHAEVLEEIVKNPRHRPSPALIASFGGFASFLNGQSDRPSVHFSVEMSPAKLQE